MVLVGLLCNQDVVISFGYLVCVYVCLEGLCCEVLLGLLWSIVFGLVEGLVNGSVVNSVLVCILLCQFDCEFKCLVEQGVDGLNQVVLDELVKNLLFYVVKVFLQLLWICVLKEQYCFDEVLFDYEMVDVECVCFVGFDCDVMCLVVGVLCEELVWIKDSFDLFVCSDCGYFLELDVFLVLFKQIVDILVVFGFG